MGGRAKRGLGCDGCGQRLLGLGAPGHAKMPCFPGRGTKSTDQEAGRKMET